MFHLYGGNKQFKCDICEYTCSQKRDMNRHVTAVLEHLVPQIQFFTKNCTMILDQLESFFLLIVIEEILS